MNEPRYISFEDGVVRPAFNEGYWIDPMTQLRDRVLSYGKGAKLLDVDYAVLETMTMDEAVRVEYLY